MNSQTGKQIIPINTLPDILGGKENETYSVDKIQSRECIFSKKLGRWTSFRQQSKSKWLAPWF